MSDSVVISGFQNLTARPDAESGFLDQKMPFTKRSLVERQELEKKQ
jgi:hypothetical protein